MKKVTYFVVQGRGFFPTDMLRYDSCALVGDAPTGDWRRRRVTLTTSSRRITDARWSSFGWVVVARLTSDGDPSAAIEEVERMAEEKMGAL